ncbi:FtsW/RodA/SpoVE family cell cycle protein [Paenibacillus tritici]|uniref:FtsW/RodA/SpoVE family cell cycle protein n=1 Tax=Paenibacillus tritici TaxID=1873425 RepID=A0ABX2DKE1_9BACL|nr:FtsW/RodA/SpoVE family cell cycle protein [Paenibacillus tritici]NQX44129.1 FtsW/RodA/SpoVE family cell cycle protein [Paenibacillus tritici]
MTEQGKQNLGSYLDKVCAEIRAKEMHIEIRDELSGHYADLVAERMQLGASEAEAQEYAIAQMGDPQVIGKDLHHIHKPRIPWGLLAGVLLLSAVSLLGMGSIEAGGYFERNQFVPMQRQLIIIIIGMCLMTGAYFINFKRLQKASTSIYLAALMTIALSVLLMPVMINGSRRFVGALGFYIDLIGYSPYVFVVALAGIFTRPDFLQGYNIRVRELLKLSLLLLPAVIYVMIRSFPELIIYGVVSLTMYVWVSRRWVTGILIAAVSLFSGGIYVWSDPILRERLIGAINYNLRPDTTGYMNRTIVNVIHSAGWRGQGYGYNGDVIPYAYTDLFPAYLIQCFGWAGGLLILAVVGWFVLKMISYARAVSDTYGRMLIIGLALMISIRLVYGLSILSGRVPLTSIPFPFLSYGQHVLIEFAAVGLLMAVYRRKDMLPASQVPA